MAIFNLKESSGVTYNQICDLRDDLLAAGIDASIALNLLTISPGDNKKLMYKICREHKISLSCEEEE